ncbi:MAG: ATP-binding protein, partial [Oscillospiraceae bacterium]|nr:ATP-binding protein [Oscillospiraceae bacterium]
MQLSARLHALTVFRNLLKDRVLQSLSAYMDGLGSGHITESVDRYCEFVYSLLESDSPSLAEHVQGLVNDDENVYIRAICNKRELSPSLAASVNAELEILQQIADLTPEALTGPLGWKDYIPGFEAGSTDIAGQYRHRTENIGRYGYGMYARYYMFHVSDAHEIVPVKNPDTQRLADLVDYKREQGIILDNTKALLAGKPAANILLTGDAGTGKSSTIKAVVNELKDQGLRIL